MKVELMIKGGLRVDKSEIIDSVVHTFSKAVSNTIAILEHKRVSTGDVFELNCGDYKVTGIQYYDAGTDHVLCWCEEVKGEELEELKQSAKNILKILDKLENEKKITINSTSIVHSELGNICDSDVGYMLEGLKELEKL